MRAIDADALKKTLSESIKDASLYIQATVDQYIDEAPTITPPNEPLTCDGCYWQTHGSFGQCFGCFREKTDNYRRPPEGEGNA